MCVYMSVGEFTFVDNCFLIYACELVYTYADISFNYLKLYIYIYIHLCMCVCFCVCMLVNFFLYIFL